MLLKWVYAEAWQTLVAVGKELEPVGASRRGLSEDGQRRAHLPKVNHAYVLWNDLVRIQLEGSERNVEFIRNEAVRKRVNSSRHPAHGAQNRPIVGMAACAPDKAVRVTKSVYCCDSIPA